MRLRFVIGILMLILCTKSISLFGKQNFDKALSNEKSDSVKLQMLDDFIKESYSKDKLEDLYKYQIIRHDLAIKSGNSEAIINSYIQFGQNKMARDFDFDSALFFLYKGLKVLEENDNGSLVHFSKINNMLGLTHKNNEQFDSALHYYNQALVFINDTPELVINKWKILSNFSRLYRLLGNESKATDYAYQCLYLLLNNKDQDEYIDYLIGSYILLADNFSYKRSYDKSIELYQKALSLENEMPDGGRPSTRPFIYEKLGESELGKGDFEAAIYFFKKNLYYNQKIYGESHGKVLKTYLLIGHASSALGDYEEARKMYLRVEKIYMQGKGTLKLNERWWYNAIIALAKLETSSKNYESSFKYLHLLGTGLELNPKIKNPTRVRGYYLSLSENYYHQGKLDSALLAINKLIALQSIKDKIEISSHFHIVVLIKKSNIFKQMYKVDGGIENLKNALSTLQSADTIIARKRVSYKSQGEKIDFNTSMKDVYNESLVIAYALYKATSEEIFLKNAFDFSEKSRAMVLRNTIEEGVERIKYRGLGDSLLEMEESLQGQIQFYQNRLLSKRGLADSVVIKRLENSLFKARVDYENLLVNLENNHKEYFRYKYINESISFIEIQQKMLPTQTLLEYKIVRDSLYVFTIDKNNVSLDMIILESELDSLISEFRASILNKDGEKVEALGNRLYKILIAPLETKIKTEELVVIPDGKLWYVNFDLLNTGSDDNVRYLLEDYAFSYANSIDLLFDHIETEKPLIRECLAFSYSDSISNPEVEKIDFNTLRNLSYDLPGTRKEINQISRIIPGTYYFGKSANEQNFKEQAPHYSLIHIAVHGQIDDEHPDYSKLKFSNREIYSKEDNFLHSFELYNMTLAADLVVLSACDTGIGKLAKGEGVMSLGRSFKYAGAKSLMISNWEVLDDVAPEIMTGFYTYLKEGESKSQALRKAKLDFIRDASLYRKAPYHWGSYSIIGNPNAINLVSKNNISWYWYFFAGFLILLLTSILIFRLRKS